MHYAKNLKESSYRRDADDRNDIKWAHPELVKWWVAWKCGYDRYALR